METLKVVVRRGITDYVEDEVDISEIDGVHWDNISGGVHKKQGGHALYGYISYELAEKLNIKCSGRHNWGYNSAKVCIPAVCNKGEYRKGYNSLLKQAGEKPQSDISKNRPAGQGPCTKKILYLLGQQKMFERGELRQMILDIGYGVDTFQRAIKQLEKDNKIILKGSSNSKYQKVSLNPENGVE